MEGGSDLDHKQVTPSTVLSLIQRISYQKPGGDPIAAAASLQKIAAAAATAELQHVLSSADCVSAAARLLAKAGELPSKISAAARDAAIAVLRRAACREPQRRMQASTSRGDVMSTIGTRMMRLRRTEMDELGSMDHFAPPVTEPGTHHWRFRNSTFDGQSPAAAGVACYMVNETGAVAAAAAAVADAASPSSRREAMLLLAAVAQGTRLLDSKFVEFLERVLREQRQLPAAALSWLEEQGSSGGGCCSGGGGNDGSSGGSGSSGGGSSGCSGSSSGGSSRVNDSSGGDEASYSDPACLLFEAYARSQCPGAALHLSLHEDRCDMLWLPGFLPWLLRQVARKDSPCASLAALRTLRLVLFRRLGPDSTGGTRVPPDAPAEAITALIPILSGGAAGAGGQARLHLALNAVCAAFSHTQHQERVRGAPGLGAALVRALAASCKEGALANARQCAMGLLADVARRGGRCCEELVQAGAPAVIRRAIRLTVPLSSPGGRFWGGGVGGEKGVEGSREETLLLTSPADRFPHLIDCPTSCSWESQGHTFCTPGESHGLGSTLLHGRSC